MSRFSFKQMAFLLLIWPAAACVPDQSSKEPVPPEQKPGVSEGVCSIDRLRQSLDSCLAGRESQELAQAESRIQLWAQATGDPSGRPGQFPIELLDLSAFRSRFSITDAETRCLKAELCSFHLED